MLGSRRRVRLRTQPHSKRCRGRVFLPTGSERKTDVGRRRIAGGLDRPGGGRELLRLSLEVAPRTLPLLAPLRAPPGRQAVLVGHLPGREPLGPAYLPVTLKVCRKAGQSRRKASHPRRTSQAAG